MYIKDLKIIMNCRVKGNTKSHFGGQECAEFADSIQKYCSKYLSFSAPTESFVEGSIEYLILKLRNKAREDEKYADIPVMFLTGMTEKNTVIRTLTELKPQGYIIKPSKKSELVGKIIDVFEQED